MQLAANLSWMYPKLPWAERFAAAAADGFRGAEILLPYEHPPQWYAQQLRAAGLDLALINTPVGTEPAGRLGWAAVPGAQAQFRQAFDEARAVAQATGCQRIHVMAGWVQGHERSDCDAQLRLNLEHALRLAEQDGLLLTLEPLNRTDMPGYHYHLPEQVLAVLETLAHPRLKLQLDFYHCVREGLDPVACTAHCGPWTGHVQIAGAEGRHEPDLGQSGLLAAVSALPAQGYDSWLGCEYQPRHSAAAGLAWAQPLRSCGVLS